MNCPSESRELAELLAFSAQQIEGPEAVELKQHVESCAACQEFVSRQSAVWRALDGWEPPPITMDFDERLYRRIEQRFGWWDRYLQALRPFLVRQGLPIAAAACLIVVAGLVSQRPADQAAAPPAAAAQVENLQPEQVELVLDDMQMLSDFTRAARSDAGEL